jgi:DNA-directed RNA polymerase
MVSAIYLPMIVPPKPWNAPVNGGYLSIRTTLMRVKDWKTQMGSVIQVWRTTPILDPLFNGLNSLGKTPWKVNKEVYDVIQGKEFP